MSLHGRDATFKPATLNMFDDVSNFNQSVWVSLIPQDFTGIVIVDVGSITFIVI